jgi:hypothetical protein
MKMIKQNVTFTLSEETIKLLNDLSARFSKENKVKISRNVIIERAIDLIKTKNVFEVLGVIE